MKKRDIVGRVGVVVAMVLMWGAGAMGAERAGDDAGAPGQGVTVQKAAVKVGRRSFDPKKPPKDMPPRPPGEAARTEYDFGCSAQADYRTTSDIARAEATITAVQVHINLDIVVWLPIGANAKLKAHEEGHKQIAESGYEHAEDVARRLGQALVGRKLDVRGEDDEAVAAAVQEAIQGLCKRYMEAVAQRDKRVQEKYDALTDHGRNKVPEKKAIEEAWGSERGESGSDGVE